MPYSTADFGTLDFDRIFTDDVSGPGRLIDRVCVSVSGSGQ